MIILSLPLAWRAYRVSRDNYDRIDDLLAANVATIGLHSLVGPLLIAALALGRLV